MGLYKYDRVREGGGDGNWGGSAERGGEGRGGEQLGNGNGRVEVTRGGGRAEEASRTGTAEGGGVGWGWGRAGWLAGWLLSPRRWEWGGVVVVWVWPAPPALRYSSLVVGPLALALALACAAFAWTSRPRRGRGGIVAVHMLIFACAAGNPAGRLLVWFGVSGSASAELGLA